jgi:hypothetical protein
MPVGVDDEVRQHQRRRRGDRGGGSRGRGRGRVEYMEKWSLEADEIELGARSGFGNGAAVQSHS